MGAVDVKRLVLALAALTATPALAQSRDYCPERPGLDTPACIVDRGHVSVETGVVDWTLDRQPDARTDTLLIGDTLVRVGVSDTVEARIGWTPYGHQRVRDRQSGAIDRTGRVGDVSLGVKASLAHPDGNGFSVAALPYVTLPVGRTPIGAGTWGAGFLLPLSYDVSERVQLDATPEVDAQPNADQPGRHLRYSAAGGATFKLSEAVSFAAEGQLIQDNDPDEHTTQALAALSVAWQPADDWQLDLYGVAGLNHDAPDVELSAGISRRF
ncbi:transporter [Sphingomonas sp. RP10(2022)]|uniref:Transporter n=1 Tax=Sphingomonas liriopis TaxID=2949094 RepID=A0A9X2HRP6_9SPHN|nr:transporter [Sphingomonas liriopis]MCP3735242.1 transporter [Sphingomonas liriopis]